MHIVSPRLASLGSLMLLLAACSDDGWSDTSAPTTASSDSAQEGP